MRIAINGFGRIGKCLLRAVHELKYQELEIVAINSSASAEAIAHYLKYDSIHGIFNGNIEHTPELLILNSTKIKLCNNYNPEQLPWGELNVDLVMECTGKFKERDQASKHLNAGAKRVLISAPGTNEDISIVVGINNKELKPEHKIISAGSCTTNCFLPILNILHKEIGVEKGCMTTIHSYTNDQRTLDGNHKDLYRSRACNLSMIPTATGAEKMIAKIIPDLIGKIAATAIRVPISNVSMIDFCFNSKSNTSAKKINHLVKMHVEKNKDLQNVVAICNEQLVSIDFLHNSHSAIFDLNGTKVTAGNFCRISSWYDNEWGFSTRMLDITMLLKRLT